MALNGSPDLSRRALPSLSPPAISDPAEKVYNMRYILCPVQVGPQAPVPRVMALVLGIFRLSLEKSSRSWDEK